MNKRQLEILKIVAEAGMAGIAVTVAMIRQRLQNRVSPATVYNDLEILAHQRIVKDRGIVGFQSDSETDLLERTRFRPAVKVALAESVVKNIVFPAAVIFLDTGTTCLEIANELVRQERQDVTVITANPHALSVLTRSRSVKAVVCLGGLLRSEAASLHGPLTVAALNEVHFDIALVSVDFIHSDSTISLATFSNSETDQKRVACRRARSSVSIVADDSKLGRNLGHVFSDVETVSRHSLVNMTIGTELGLSPEFSERFRAVCGSNGTLSVVNLAELRVA